MKHNKYCVRVISALITIMLLFAVLPVSTALADTSGPKDAGTGTNVTGMGNSAWQNPGNITVPGAPFATAVLNKTNLITNYLQGTQYGFSIPTGATINGIQVVINRQSDFHNPSIEDNVVSLVKGGTIVGNNKASGSVWPTSMMTATYGSATDLWGTTWTAAEINDPSFGVVLSAQRHNNGNNDRTASVDHMQITVYYSYGTSTTIDCGNGTPVVTYGDSLTCVATVTRLTSSGTPSGTVNWVSGGSGSFSSNSCTLAGSGGIATCSVSYTPSLVGSGSHFITATYGGDEFFSPSSGNQPVTVYPKEASVTPDATGKTYGDADPILTGTLAGFLYADGVEASYSRTSGETVLGSPYTISAVLSPTEVLDNYDITYNTADFTITPATPNCEVTSYDVTYDGVAHTATGSCLGVDDEELSGLDLSGTTHTDAWDYTDLWTYTDVTGNYADTSGTVDDSILKADAVCTVTSYDVTYDGDDHTASGYCLGVKDEELSGLELSGTTHMNAGDYLADTWIFTDTTGNYNDDSGTVDDNIDKADAVCTVTSYAMVYDGDPHTATGSCLGVDGETLSGLDLSGTTHTDAGTYDGDTWTFTDVTGNYNDDNGTVDDSINPKEASVTPDAAGKTYGDLDPTLTGTLAGFLEADGVEASYSRVAGETVLGSPYEITAVLSPTEVLSNYDITYNTADFTIDKRSIEVTADAKSKVYGDSDPELTYQITSGSLTFGDTFSGTLDRESGEDVGTYAITQGTLALSDNYDLTFIGVDFTINKRSVEVTADAQSKPYGDPDPELTYQVTSGWLVPGDVFTGTLYRKPGEDVGTYAITQGTLALSDNYDLSFFTADLTITLRPITVTADPQTKLYGEPDPVLTYQVTSGSLVPGDVFTGALNRESGEDVGTVAITQGSLALPDYYDLSYVGNYLTITGGIRVKLFLPIIIEQPH